MRMSITWMAMKDSDRVSQVLPAQSLEAIKAEQRMRHSFEGCGPVLDALTSWSAREVQFWVGLYSRCRSLTRSQRRALENYCNVVGD